MNFTQFPQIDFVALRNELKSETPALFGNMIAQQMIEHLYTVYNFALVDEPIKVLTEPEKIEKVKKLFLWSPGGFKQNVSNKFTKTLSFDTIFENMETAINNYESKHILVTDLLLNKVVENKTHPIFGLLDNKEWIQFFTKHTWHHFNQFGLVK
jgi:hypothetical protein